MPDRDTTQTARPPARRPSFTRLPVAPPAPALTEIAPSTYPGVAGPVRLDGSLEVDWRSSTSTTCRPPRREAITAREIPSVRGVSR